jgi:probable addiction module antidote protein
MRRFDPAYCLDDEKCIAGFLKLAAEEMDEAMFSSCLTTALIARGVNQLSLETGLFRDKLHEILLGGAKPANRHVAKVIKALSAPLANRKSMANC